MKLTCMDRSSGYYEDDKKEGSIAPSATAFLKLVSIFAGSFRDGVTK